MYGDVCCREKLFNGLKRSKATWYLKKITEWDWRQSGSFVFPPQCEISINGVKFGAAAELNWFIYECIKLKGKFATDGLSDTGWSCLSGVGYRTREVHQVHLLDSVFEVELISFYWTFAFSINQSDSLIKREKTKQSWIRDVMIVEMLRLIVYSICPQLDVFLSK